MKTFLFLIVTCGIQAASTNEAAALAKNWNGKVLNEGIHPHWLSDGEGFWYERQLTGGKKEFVFVPSGAAEQKTAMKREDLKLPPPPSRRSTEHGLWTYTASPESRTPVAITFVNQWSEALEVKWLDYSGDKKSYGIIPPGKDLRQNTFKGHRWSFEDAKTGQVIAIMESLEDGEQIIIDGYPPRRQTEPLPANLSPEAGRSVTIQDNRVLLRDLRMGKAEPMDFKPTPKNKLMGTVTWSPDSRLFVVPSVLDVTRRKIHIVDSTPEKSLQPKVNEITYVKPGDPLPKPVPVVFDREKMKGLMVADDLFPNPFTTASDLEVRWSPDSREFYFDYNQRGHQLYRIIGVDAATAKARVVVEETSRTFIDYTHKTWRHWLNSTAELLWMSERDGWCHLYLYDTKTGTLKNQVTQGAWPVREVLHVDEARREIWFLASGLRDNEDPYHLHLCRVNFDGSGFQQLTQGDGNHHVEFSPNRSRFIDTWSRADMPPVHELRRSRDGSLLCELEKADATQLLAAGWTMPERFVAKGRDGQTDIHGILIKPSHFDPAKKYPVIEDIYAGPHSAFAPKDFGRLLNHHILAELGFIIVKLDGMGTNHRGKVFHDVCWKNIKDAGFPDRIAWIKAAAQTRPWMDLTRVGIYGGSAGGQNAMRALLDHHDFYHVAVADCGCHDNRMDKIWWNEQWMGWPVDESYARSSNKDDAHKLEGHLLLIVGELDTNVDPATTTQVVGALQKAGKTFDFMPIIGTGHGAAETPYGSRLRMEFLVRHLRP